MRKLGIVFALCIAVVFATSFVTPAFAQATRTWVSGVGDDANPCSRTAPCKTFAGAISKTTPAGEINVLDPGGFGAVTITKAITIRADHVEAGVLVQGVNGIVVQAGPTDMVVLEGLDIEGLGSGLDGVRIISVGTVHIIRCSIHHFTGNGVNLVSITPGAVIIKDSHIMQNGGGLNVQGTGGGNHAAIAINTLFDFNTSFAVQATGAANAISLISSVIIGNVNAPGGAQVVSFGPSNVFAGGGAPTASVPFR